MTVKHPKTSRIIKLSFLAFASTSLTACSGVNLSSPGKLWKDITNERDPQVVTGPRRKPMLNQGVYQGQPAPQAQPRSAAKQTNPYPQSNKARRGNAPSPYEQSQREQQYNAPREDSSLFDQVGSWFSSMSSSDVTPAPVAKAVPSTIEEPAFTVASVPPKPRKPINGSQNIVEPYRPVLAQADTPKPVAVPIRSEEPVSKTDQLLAQITEKDPVKPAKDETPKLLAVALPKQQELNEQEIPEDPEAPKQLAAMMPAAGPREEKAEPIVVNVSEEEFKKILAEEVMYDMTPIGGPETEKEAQASVQQHAGDQLLAEASEYPPLKSVPPTPHQFNEVRHSHPEFKQELMETREGAEHDKVNLHREVQEEYDDSLRKEYLEKQGSHHPTPPSTFTKRGLLPLPPLQFAGELPRRVGGAFDPSYKVMPASHTTEDDGFFFGLFSEANYEEAPVELIDEQLQIDTPKEKTIAAKAGKEAPAIQTSAPVLPPPIAPKMAAVVEAGAPKEKHVAKVISKPQSDDVKVAANEVNEAEKYHDALMQGFRMSQFKREIIGVFSLVPHYVYMPVISEAREVVYFPESRYLGYR